MEQKKTQDEFYKEFAQNASPEDVKTIDKDLNGMNRGPIAKIWDKVNQLYSIVNNSDTPWTTKATAVAALLYLVTPLDAVPDFAPIVGLLDDAAIITLAISQLSGSMDTIFGQKGHKNSQNNRASLQEIFNKELAKNGLDECFKNMRSKKADNPYLYFLASKSYYDLSNEDGANSIVRVCDDVLNYIEKGSDIYCEILNCKLSAIESVASNNDNINILTNLRKLYLDLSQYSSNDNEICEIIEQSKKEFERLTQSYTLNFLNIPYENRKLLVPVKEYTTLNQAYVTILKIDSLPSDIRFSTVHPIENELYISHPYRTNLYVPYQGHELDFLKDKIDELCTVLSALGATEINIERVSKQSNNRKQDGFQAANIGGGYKAYQGNVGGEQTTSEELIEKINSQICCHRKNNPTKEPYLPENLVWYPNESKWQRIYNNRMQGIGDYSKDLYALNSNNYVSNDEQIGIKADYKDLLINASVSYDSKYSNILEVLEDVVLSIEYTFAPLSSFTKKKSFFQKIFPIND